MKTQSAGCGRRYSTTANRSIATCGQRRQGARRPDGNISELPNTGIPPGILEDAKYEQSGPIELSSGEVIQIGTDGIWEARNAEGDMFGKDRLRKILTDSSHKSATEIHDIIVDSVRTFSQTPPQEDDVTLVVIRALWVSTSRQDPEAAPAVRPES